MAFYETDGNGAFYRFIIMILAMKRLRSDVDGCANECREDRPMGKRRQRRLSVKDLTITIDGRTYRVFNINEYGVGFLIDSPEEIEIGNHIRPVTINAPVPVRVAGTPRHVSFFQATGEPLKFVSGWVCGMEFSTRRHLDARKLLREYFAENMGSDDED